MLQEKYPRRKLHAIVQKYFIAMMVGMIAMIRWFANSAKFIKLCQSTLSQKRANFGKL